jgi:hypothetical protein
MNGILSRVDTVGGRDDQRSQMEDSKDTEIIGGVGVYALPYARLIARSGRGNGQVRPREMQQ